MSSAAFLPIVALPRLRPRAGSSQVQVTPQRLYTRMAASHDLLIIGGGCLGSRIGRLWRERHPTSEIVVETSTTKNHAELSSLGVTPRLAGQETRPFSRAVLCVPPSANEDYPGLVAASAKRAPPPARFIFTSSSSVNVQVGLVDERSPRGGSKRADLMRDAEDAAFDAGGVVVRLSGLYTLTRGPHPYYFQKGECLLRKDSLINLIHYDDAAKAVVCVAEKEELPGNAFLVTAARPTTARELLDEAKRLPMYADLPLPKCNKDGSLRTKRFDNSWTREVLGWKPEFEHFSEFVQAELRTAEQRSGSEGNRAQSK